MPISARHAGCSGRSGTRPRRCRLLACLVQDRSRPLHHITLPAAWAPSMAATADAAVGPPAAKPARSGLLPRRSCMAEQQHFWGHKPPFWTILSSLWASPLNFSPCCYWAFASFCPFVKRGQAVKATRSNTLMLSDECVSIVDCVRSFLMPAAPVSVCA